MSHRYAALPNPRSAQPDRDGELEAAFDYSEDEDDHNTSESQPLNTSANTVPSAQPSTPPPPQPTTPGTYDFENADYDYPPPGSPPRPSAVALPNSIGNSNGQVPSFESVPQPQPRGNWLRRTAAAVLPSQLTERLGISAQRPSHPIGGGINNDGVFANVTAKPSRQVRIQDGDDTYLVPEDARAEAPPSYASAQADAVPPYWETTVHAPFAPNSIGEMIIDSLPTGSLFSFLWNMLVSVSFQFVGFLLTYLLHTTHAARLGSRAGLGVTLIQYGFALRAKVDPAPEGEGDVGSWGSWKESHMTGATTSYYHGNDTMDGLSPEQETSILLEDATTEWLSFFLMTIGWFILLTSVMGFYRVKRWERGILASRRETNTAAAQEGTPPDLTMVNPFERMFGLRGMSRGDLFRVGFGFPGRQRQREREQQQEAEDRDLADLEAGNAQDASETDAMLAESQDPRSRMLAQVLAHERRLQRDLREAGLLL
ncbi:hypothetical protein BDN72DRAFT_350069 [Pluteus cervinus]|uniref:Uncharacterized protein n=1 Tax=Pluteus cervinus TaxID=181527 RepID=A0ACD3BD48_9AGAR|nr:hypothetical protein BDN72DRAFT_350069 [Pluteus cervinus]